MKRLKKKLITCLLLATLLIGTVTPSVTVLADTNTVTVNNKTYSEEEFSRQLEQGFWIEDRFAAEVGATTLFIPGVGQAVVTAARIVILGGVALGAGHWAYGKIINTYKEHTKNKRKPNWKPRK